MNFINKNDLFYIIKKNYPFIIFFIVVLFLHLFMGIARDDLGYSTILAKFNLFEWLIGRYNTWSSRLIIDAASVILARENMIIWKILDSLIYTVGTYLAIKFINILSNYEYDKIVKYFGVLLFLIYPFYDMFTAGWIATTLNYSWCFGLGMVSFLPLMNHYENKQTSIYTYIISFLCLLYAINQEQSCALIFGFNLVYLIHCIYNKKNINKFNIIAIIVSCLSLIFILTCPGNSVRLACEITEWYPAFTHLNIYQKLYLGTVSTIGTLITEKTIILLFYILLNICAIVKTKNKYLKYVCYFNILLILSLVGLDSLLSINNTIQHSPNFKTIIENNNLLNSIVMTTSNNINSISIHQPIITQILNMITYQGHPSTSYPYALSLNMPLIIAASICIYLLLSSCLLLYKIFSKTLLPLTLFIGGFMSKLILGFSPTVYASNTRTIIFFNMILIMLILLLITELYGENKINTKHEHLMKVVFIIFAIISCSLTISKAI